MPMIAEYAHVWRNTAAAARAERPLVLDAHAHVHTTVCIDNLQGSQPNTHCASPVLSLSLNRLRLSRATSVLLSTRSSCRPAARSGPPSPSIASSCRAGDRCDTFVIVVQH